jgi:hypothetical protein
VGGGVGGVSALSTGSAGAIGASVAAGGAGVACAGPSAITSTDIDGDPLDSSCVVGVISNSSNNAACNATDTNASQPSGPRRRTGITNRSRSVSMDGTGLSGGSPADAPRFEIVDHDPA